MGVFEGVVVSGRRRHLVTLQTRTETLNDLGEATLTYTDVGDVWAEKKSVSARERLMAQQVKADVTHRFVFGFADAYAAVGPEDRIVHDGVAYDIVSLMDRAGTRRDIEVTALELL